MVDLLSTAFASLGPNLLVIGGVALGIGVTLFGLKVGYRLLQFFIIGNAGGGGNEYTKADDAAEWRKDQRDNREIERAYHDIGGK